MVRVPSLGMLCVGMMGGVMLCSGHAWAQPADEPVDPDIDLSEIVPDKSEDEAPDAPAEPPDAVAIAAEPIIEPEDTSLPELEFEWGVKLQSDLRFRVEKKSVGNWYEHRELPVGIDRNENILGGRFIASYGDVSAVADIDFVIYGFAQEVDTLLDLSRREELDPFRFDVHKLYIHIKDLGLDGLDLSVGQMLVLWGVGDQFNPTNNLNADDIEDVLLFGEQQGNFMVKADYWIDEAWSISGVIVPVFRPALLPLSGELAVARTDRIPIADEGLRHRIIAEQAAARTLGGTPTVVRNVTPVLPEKTIDNVQLGYRIGGTIGGQDISASYYRGRTDFPVPFRNHTSQDATPRCNPDNGGDCIAGLLNTDVSLHYPRMNVYGFNFTGEIPFLDNLGYRMEVALIDPERSTLRLTNDDLNVGLPVPAGEYDYDNDGAPGGREPVVIDDTPFAKWTVGLDYTFTKELYANIQWVHGLADEYGAGDWISDGDAVRASSANGPILQCAIGRDGSACAREVLRPRIADYLVTGIDLRLLDQKLLLRLFTIFDLTGIDVSRFDPDTGERTREHFHMFTKEGFGAVIYPEVNYNFGNGLDLGGGTLLQLGRNNGKFGDPAAGGSIVWTRARFAF